MPALRVRAARGVKSGKRGSSWRCIPELRAARQSAPCTKKFHDEEIFQPGIVLRPRRKHHDTVQTLGFPVEIALIVAPDDLDHFLHDLAFDILIYVGFDLEEFAPGVAGIGRPSLEGELGRVLAEIDD